LKYLKQQHGGYVNTSSVRTVLYPHLGARDGPSKKTLSRLLGLPSRLDAMALMGFLASTDGRFSEAAMASAVLLDANGRRINAVETDAGITLTVCKERDADDGWQDVSLNSEAAVFVRRWIQLTEPLRSYARARHRRLAKSLCLRWETSGSARTLQSLNQHQQCISHFCAGESGIFGGACEPGHDSKNPVDARSSRVS
jgi:hypothetical protein